MSSRLFPLWAAAALSAALPAVACRNAAGEACRKASDCRDGLVCVIGSEVVGPDDPVTSAVGECIDDDMMIDDETSVSPPSDDSDLPTSRRDLGTDDTGDTGTTSDTGDTGTTSDTGDTGTTSDTGNP
jgi:hypothetical protein